ncbi:diguanylate cyclase domain-containing protein [Azospirillum sp.]|uniref:diguanylate cyclase domain-containing protein n=1 Tax=Azospirillum sp. TaxID=34012 RepID=UPI003D70AB87
MDRAIDASLSRALAELWRGSAALGVNDAIQHGLELAVGLTGSAIGYFHFVNDDQETLELVTWSAATRAVCAAWTDRHYPVSKAGVWVDCLRTRAPVVHNDYEALEHKRGLPDGHVRLVRHMNVPLVEGPLVRFIVGVGNKPTDYTDDDVAALTAFAADLWLLIQQKQEVAALRHRAGWLARIQRITRSTGFEWDIDADALGFDGNAGVLTGGDSAAPHTMAHLRHLVVEGDRGAFSAALDEARRAPGQLVGEVVRMERPDGRRWTARLMLRADPRERGSGLVLRGVLQDISDELNAEEYRHKAFHDYLTELANREMLVHRLSGAVALLPQRTGAPSGGGLALHMLDLDRFKPVNDTHGHSMGDAVLKQVAKRLQAITRRSDVVARVGGDEFAILQLDVSSPEDAATLAAKIIAALSEPYEVDGRTLTIGVSIGIALGNECGGTPDLLLRDADEALYRCKAAGGGRYAFHGEAPVPSPGAGEG